MNPLFEGSNLRGRDLDFSLQFAFHFSNLRAASSSLHACKFARKFMYKAVRLARQISAES